MVLGGCGESLARLMGGVPSVVVVLVSEEEGVGVGIVVVRTEG